MKRSVRLNYLAQAFLATVLLTVFFIKYCPGAKDWIKGPADHNRPATMVSSTKPSTTATPIPSPTPVNEELVWSAVPEEDIITITAEPESESLYQYFFINPKSPLAVEQDSDDIAYAFDFSKQIDKPVEGGTVRVSFRNGMWLVEMNVDKRQMGVFPNGTKCYLAGPYDWPENVPVKNLPYGIVCDGKVTFAVCNKASVPCNRYTKFNAFKVKD